MLKKIIGIGSAVTVSILIAGCSENPIQSSVNYVETPRDATILTGTTTNIPIPDNPYRPSMMKSTNPSYPYNLEMVRRTLDDRIEHLWYNDNARPNQWNSQAFFANNVVCDPAICSNRNDNLLNVVVRQNVSDRFYKLTLWYRLEDQNGHHWHEGDVIGSRIQGSPAMICNNCKVNGKYNLEVVAWSLDNKLVHYTRDEVSHNWTSQDLPALPPNWTIVQSPVMIQEVYGTIFVVTYAHNGYGTKLITFTKRSSSNPWTLNGIPPENSFDRNVRPSVSTYGNGQNFSILFKYTWSNDIYEACTPSSTFYFDNPRSIYSNNNSVDNISAVDLCIQQTLFYSFRTTQSYCNRAYTTEFN
jgi:hypothetical protein